jgi:hypothetical protein
MLASNAMSKRMDLARVTFSDHLEQRNRMLVIESRETA